MNYISEKKKLVSRSSQPARMARIFLCFFIVMLLPGCGAIIDWSKDAINQGRETEISVQQARNAIRSIAVYDQFTLLGKFDVLWLSDTVRTTFVRMYALKWGKSTKQTEEFMGRQLEENKRSIVFYVLYPFDKTPLGMIDSTWSLFLQIDGHTGTSYAPLEIRTIELSPEYQKIFGPVYTRFKEAYQVTFDATTIDDQPLITPKTQQLTLCFRSVAKQACLTWQLHDGEPSAEHRIDRTVREFFDTHAHEQKRAPKKHEKVYARRTGKKERSPKTITIATTECVAGDRHFACRQKTGCF